MATATQKARTATQVGRAARKAPESASMLFLVEQENCGGYHWVILAGSGERLVRSTSFASYESAERAALQVRAGAGSARVQPRPGDHREAGVLDRRDTAASGEPERWRDEGGSLTGATATK
jgi:uncharacterized protein YegP (UPF0339 family)